MKELHVSFCCENSPGDAQPRYFGLTWDRLEEDRVGGGERIFASRCLSTVPEQALLLVRVYRPLGQKVTTAQRAKPQWSAISLLGSVQAEETNNSVFWYVPDELLFCFSGTYIRSGERKVWVGTEREMGSAVLRSDALK